jgi:outer membrane immunogenic protein
MIRKLILAAAAGLVSSSALAADLPRYTPPMFQPVPALFDWSGFYLGVHGGWAWGQSDIGDTNGGVLGGQLGYNWAGPSGLFGVEVDSAWVGIDNSANTFPPFIGPVNANFKADYEGSARLRLGATNDTALYYVTGGVAWMHAKFSGSAIGVSVSDSNTHVGWTVGAGVEYAYSPYWTGRLEYRYTDYGAKDYFNVPFSAQTHMVKFAVNFLTH